MGYYEWKSEGSAKITNYFSLKNRKVFMFAGLYNEISDEIGTKGYSFTIITTEPNSLQKPIHNRMPAILAEEDEEKWLTADVDDAIEVLGPYTSDEMQVWEVDRKVGNSKINNPDLI